MKWFNYLDFRLSMIMNGILTRLKAAFWGLSIVSGRKDTSEQTSTDILDLNINAQLLACARFAEQCDGFVYTSGEAFEAEAIYATRQWLKESGDRPLYAVGPILPPREVKQAALNPTSALGSPASDQSSQGSNFQEFMDKVLAQHGKNSLLYVSLN